MNEDMVTLIVTSGVIALVAAAVAAVIVVVRYKRRLKAPIYPIEKYASLSLTGGYDNYLGSSVTRVRVESGKRK